MEKLRDIELMKECINDAEKIVGTTHPQGVYLIAIAFFKKRTNKI